MDLIANLSLGFGVAFTPINLMYALVGCILGTLIGVLPGIGPVATIAMLLPPRMRCRLCRRSSCWLVFTTARNTVVRPPLFW